MDAAIQTSSNTKNAAVTAKTPTSSTGTQTKKLPVFTGQATIIEEGEETAPEEKSVATTSDRRLRPRTPAQQDAVVPPPTEVYNTPADSERDLFPQPKRRPQAEDQHPFTFRYQDGSQPATKITRLYRYDKTVRVIDLDLRHGSSALKAAANGYYFDDSYGKRLFLNLSSIPPRSRRPEDTQDQN